MRVLLVAESFDVRYWLEGSLARSGRKYTVHWVANDVEARSRMSEGLADVVVVDFAMADERGLTLVREVSEQGAALPTVALLPGPDSALESLAIRLGVAAVLVRGDDSPGGIERAVRVAVERNAFSRALRIAPTSLSVVPQGAAVDRVELSVARARRKKAGFAVAQIEIGRDEERIDAQVLAGVVDGLVDIAGGADGVLRTGSRSFLVVVESGVEARAYRQLADRILAVATRGDVGVLPRIGMACFPDHAQGAEGLVELAQAAVPSVDVGVAAASVHGEREGSSGSRAAELRRLLPRAIQQGELFLVYQPQVRIANGDVVGAEALMRWKSPDLGLVSPGEFVPVAEELGLISELGGRALVEACMQAKRWYDAGAPIRVAVNVSARQFGDGLLDSVVRGALATSGLEPMLLELEITEGVLLENTSAARRVLEELRELGVLVAVDDFGTGYSSFTYVKRLPMDVIKIDREFIRGLPLDQENAAITAAIVALARALGLDVVAEGVENESEEEFLRSLGCEIVQGYLHGRPMSAADFDAWRDGRRVTMVESRRAQTMRARLNTKHR